MMDEVSNGFLSTLRQTFLKSQRLLTRPQFDFVFQGGSKIVGRHLVLVGIPTNDSARIGIIVSKKVGNAIVRNQVKRIVRECFRQSASLLPKIDLVVIARPIAADATYQQINDDFFNCIRRLRQKLQTELA